MVRGDGPRRLPAPRQGSRTPGRGPSVARSGRRQAAVSGPTRRESSNIRARAQAAGHALTTGTISDQQTTIAKRELLLAERHAALREALTRLPPSCQRLVAVLIEDPPMPYSQISARLGIPAGSVGPCRRRCLDKPRRDPAIAVLINTEGAPAAGELPTDPWS